VTASLDWAACRRSRSKDLEQKKGVVYHGFVDVVKRLFFILFFFFFLLFSRLIFARFQAKLRLVRCYFFISTREAVL
jgi:hypothetical protein